MDKEAQKQSLSGKYLTPPKTIASGKKLANYCSLSYSVLWNLMTTRSFPKPCHFTHAGRRAVYKLSDIDAWLAKQAPNTKKVVQPFRNFAYDRERKDHIKTLPPLDQVMAIIFLGKPYAIQQGKTCNVKQFKALTLKYLPTKGQQHEHR